MLYFSPAKMIAITLACIAALIYAIPNFFDKDTVAGWPDWVPKKQLQLGLDLRGGAHMLLSMDTTELRTNMLDNLREDVRARLREAKIGTVGTGLTKDGVRVRIGRASDMPAALKALGTLSQPLSNNFLTTSNARNLTVTQQGEQSIELKLTEEGLRARVTDAMGGAIETVRRRIDAVGTTEPTIARQGESRILIQVPGIDDTAQLKRLLGRTAKLSFHAVHPTQGFSSTPQPRRGGYVSYPADETSDRAGTYYYLKRVPVVGGADLVQANPGFDSRTQEPIITFRFNQIGARKFGRFTAENVNRPFAIVLDNKVLSAPNINEPILGGSGQISGGFTPENQHHSRVCLRSLRGRSGNPGEQRVGRAPPSRQGQLLAQVTLRRGGRLHSGQLPRRQQPWATHRAADRVAHMFHASSYGTPIVAGYPTSGQSHCRSSHDHRISHFGERTIDLEHRLDDRTQVSNRDIFGQQRTEHARDVGGRESFHQVDHGEGKRLREPANIHWRWVTVRNDGACRLCNPAISKTACSSASQRGNPIAANTSACARGTMLIARPW